MSIQPVVENSVYHGLETMLDGGVIVISVHGNGSDLTVTLADNGLAFPISDSKCSRSSSPETNRVRRALSPRVQAEKSNRYPIPSLSSCSDGARSPIRVSFNACRISASFSSRVSARFTSSFGSLRLSLSHVGVCHR